MCNRYSLGMDEIPKDHDNGMKNKWIPRKVENKTKPTYFKRKEVNANHPDIHTNIPSQPCKLNSPETHTMYANEESTSRFTHPDSLYLSPRPQTSQSKILLHLPTNPLMFPVPHPRLLRHRSKVDSSPTHYQSYYRYP